MKEHCQEEIILSRMLRLAPFPACLIVLVLLLARPSAGQSQGLPGFAPLNPVGSSRSGLHFEPYHEPAPGRWVGSVALDYGSVIEYNLLPRADYVLDSELLRLNLGLSRDLDSRAFLLVDASLGGAYEGFLDGFFDWYHGALGIRVSERDIRPRDQYLYAITIPDGRTIRRARSNLFLGDLRLGFGIRHNPALQTVVSLTLPTSTGPAGYGRGVPSLSVLSTVRARPSPRLRYEGSIAVGFTPRHGSLAELQREAFLAVTSGFRARVWGRQSVFANLFYHSPFYNGTSLPALDQRDLSLDFGWILETRRGGEWRVGLTEDLEPGGPGVDLVLRVGRTF